MRHTAYRRAGQRRLAVAVRTAVRTAVRAAGRAAGRVLGRLAGLTVLTGLAALIAAGGGRTAQAAALQVSPIRVDLSVAQPAAALRLSNHGDTALLAQVRIFDWTQTPDHDHLSRATRLVASPPMVRIEAGAQQIVRIIRVDPSTVIGEEDYRLVVDEIPSNQEAADSGVKMQLRYSVPVFVAAPQRGAAGVVLFTTSIDSGGLMLMVQNQTAHYAQLSRVSIEWPDHRRTVLSEGLLGYALPGVSRRWPIVGSGGDHARFRSAKLHVNLNGQPTTTHLELAPPAIGPAG